MAEPPTLTQMAINVANMDFVRRVTPHPQVASPLQQLIVEDQQAKEDPGGDEIEDLDAEVLLNADALEDGEPVMLDFKGQGELPSMPPPPLRNLRMPPTLQQSPPASVQLSTSAIDPVQQLVQVLLTISQNMAVPPPNPPTTSQSRIRAPDTFDGSNPEDLRAFLLQCQITFNSYPRQYSMDATKVFFAISYLKKMALECFEQGVLEDNPSLTPAWRNSWTKFAKELSTHFGLANPVGSAKIELQQLTMASNTRLPEYLVHFNTLASRVRWGEQALRFQFYDGLPERLKDRLLMLGKPDSLCELVLVTQRYDNLYWERQEEQKLVCHRDNKLPMNANPRGPNSANPPATRVNERIL